MSILKLKDETPVEPEALAYAMGLGVTEPEAQAPKEVQIIVHGGLVTCVRNWPEGLPGAVYDYDAGQTPEPHRCPITALIEDGDTNSHVLINIGAFDWLIAKAMNRPKGGN